MSLASPTAGRVRSWFSCRCDRKGESVFDHPEFDGHEQVVHCHDESVGLRAIIAIHDTTLGPAAGGCRMQPYASEADALTDVLRLSKGMSYKNALAGLRLGGGKCVVLADPSTPEKHALLHALGRHVQSLGGRYWTAIDVGVGPADVDVVADECDYVFTRASEYPAGFDPSLFTALGTFTALRAAAEHVWGTDDLHGRTVAIQGLGATGRDLARQLHEAGATLVVADIDRAVVSHVVNAYGATAVDPATIHAQPVDVFAPCALGSVVDDDTLPAIGARVICGTANNQLAEARHGEALRAAGISYVPDYVANGGGVIGAAARIYSSPTLDESRAAVARIYDTTRQILTRAAAESRPPSDIADDMARRIIAAAR
ncbi:MAG: Glu/Leu/Phe/Val dehydrogenase [Ilumatobacter sp.]|nr:Glu/Leu/Phe/Val dehydrogenase [Ilumatobacter sp.]